MRDLGNGDLKVDAEPNGGRDMSGRSYEPSHGARALLERGYTTLDQASREPYSSKERRGLSPDANFPRRY